MSMLSTRIVFTGHVMSRVLCPRSSGVNFVEIVVADILTSLSRILADAALVMMLVFSACTGSDPPGEHFRGVVMTSTACIPLVLRIRQCLILGKTSPKQYSKTHILNVFKYVSAIPVAYLSFTSQDSLLSSFLTKTQLRILGLSCIVFNSIFCIAWDVFMDWGLMQKGASGLRHEPLLMPHQWMYYLAMLLNAAGRCTWSIRWLNIFHASLTPKVDSSLILQLMEVTRRALWTVFRIEWEHVRPKTELVGDHFHTTNP